MKSLLFIISITLSSFAFSQNDKPNREEFTLNLPIKDGKFYEQKVPVSPYFVNEQMLQIYPGERVFIEVETKKKAITSMKVVKENLHPEKTLQIEFTQSLSEGEHQGMMLIIKNPFDKELNYQAIMFIVGRDKWLTTSVVPVKEKLMSIEMWPDVIVSIGLSGWELIK